EDGDRLHSELRRVAEGEAVGRARVHRHGGEDAGRERTPHAADAVHAEDVESVVDLQSLRELDPDVTEGAGSETDEDRGVPVHVAGRRGDRDESGNRAGRGTEHAW